MPDSLRTDFLDSLASCVLLLGQKIRQMFHTRSSRFVSSALVLSLLIAWAIRNAGGQGTTSQDDSHSHQTREPSPPSTPTLKRNERNEGSKEQNDEVVTIETDLTNVLFTAIDKNRRFITTIQK